MERFKGAARRSDRLGLAGSVLAVAACYGTLGAIGVLSLLGITLTLNEGAWAGAITLFALLALGAIALGRRRHGRIAPAALALASVALIVWVMFVQYALLAELAGFALLTVAAIWDWKLTKNMKLKLEKDENA